MTNQYVALLRGINVSGKNRIPMAQLREICGELGWRNVQTYIQSGNVVFEADDEPLLLQDALEAAVLHHFDLMIPVIVRSAQEWIRYTEANPFRDASEEEPNRVVLTLSRDEPRTDALERIRDRAAEDERIELSGGVLWIHYGSGAGRSKLSPSFLDRVVGSPVTSRNWRTVLKLSEMLLK